MNTREELLTGLNYVKDLVARIVNVQQKQVKIVAQYRQEEAKISTDGFKNQSTLIMLIISGMITIFYLLIALITGEYGSLVFLLIIEALAVRSWKKKSKRRKGWLILLALLGAFSVLTIIIELDVVGFVLISISFAVTFFGIKFLIKWKNQKIDQENAEICKRNEELQSQYDVTVQQLKQLKQELFGQTSGWYPKDYYSLYAVDFFIHAITNHRADSIKEVVNLFEASEHQKRMETEQKNMNANLKQSLLNQEQINKELRYANVLNLVNLGMQANTQAAINRNTEALHGVRGAVNDTRYSMERVGDGIRNAISRLR